jgi:hypothetical protein
MIPIKEIKKFVHVQADVMEKKKKNVENVSFILLN